MQLLTPGLGLVIWTLLAFLVVFFILKKYAWPAILGGLRKREQTIADSLAQAEKIKTEMAQMKSENEALLAQARDERAKMIKEAKDTTAKMISEGVQSNARLKANVKWLWLENARSSARAVRSVACGSSMSDRASLSWIT